jgi:hypothetical protein
MSDTWVEFPETRKRARDDASRALEGIRRDFSFVQNSHLEDETMMNEVTGLLQRVATGEIDQSNVSQAATDHISDMTNERLTQNLSTAKQNADQNGFSDVSRQITDLLSQHGSDPQNLKQEAISLITSNPQILQHFEPQFAKDLLNRV